MDDEESWIAPISMKMVLSHHENMAGTGFPMKQKNKELECRIIQACDAFDSLISGMECKRICVQEAINQIKENNGKLMLHNRLNLMLDKNISILQVI